MQVVADEDTLNVWHVEAGQHTCECSVSKVEPTYSLKAQEGEQWPDVCKCLWHVLGLHIPECELEPSLHGIVDGEAHEGRCRHSVVDGGDEHRPVTNCAVRGMQGGQCQCLCL